MQLRRQADDQINTLCFHCDIYGHLACLASLLCFKMNMTLARREYIGSQYDYIKSFANSC